MISMPGPTIQRLDHLVLTVRDIAATLAFYRDHLGMEPVSFAGGRRALAFGAQKINLHEAGAELTPRAAMPAPGSADLCFLVAEPVEDLAERLRADGVEVIEGPVARTGATQAITSIYLRDPDGNLIELANPA